MYSLKDCVVLGFLCTFVVLTSHEPCVPLISEEQIHLFDKERSKKRNRIFHVLSRILWQYLRSETKQRTSIKRCILYSDLFRFHSIIYLYIFEEKC